MDFIKYAVFSLFIGLAHCADNTTTTTTATNTTTTSALANKTTTASPINTTTTMAAPTTTNNTKLNTTEMATTTTTVKIVKCVDAACIPYSLCDAKTNECLMKCPNATASLTNSSAKVCGSDGVTYDSLDAMKEGSCLKRVKVEMSAAGECKDEEEGNNYVIIIVVLVIVLVIIIGIVAFWIYSRRKRQSKDLKEDEKSGDNLL